MRTSLGQTADVTTCFASRRIPYSALDHCLPRSQCRSAQFDPGLAQAQCPLTGSDRTEGLKLHVRVHPEIVEKQAIQLRNLIPLPEATKDVSIFNEFWTFGHNTFFREEGLQDSPSIWFCGRLQLVIK